jgi:hypothetical protein
MGVFLSAFLGGSNSATTQEKKTSVEQHHQNKPDKELQLKSLQPTTNAPITIEMKIAKIM